MMDKNLLENTAPGRAPCSESYIFLRPLFLFKCPFLVTYIGQGYIYVIGTFSSLEYKSAWLDDNTSL